MPDPADDRGSGHGRMSPEEAAAFEARISKLDGQLGKVKAERETERRAQASTRMGGRGMAYGMRMATELVAAIIVGGLIGYGLDRWLGSTPWLFLLFFVLGFVAGVLNVLRAYERMQKEIAAETGGNIGKSVPDDED